MKEKGIDNYLEKFIANSVINGIDEAKWAEHLQALKDLKVRPGTLVAVIVRRGKVIVPFGNDHIEPGDSVVIISRQSGLSDLNEVIRK